jgi:hypothetical protein
MNLQELIKGANDILQDFINLTEEYGFRSERNMGYNYVRKKNIVENFQIEVIILHIYQRGVLIFKNKISNIVCNGGLHPQFIKTLKKIRGFGNSTGIEQEMKMRYEIYRRSE